MKMTEKKIREILESREWTFAKSMPLTPHFYIKRKDFQNEQIFEDMAAFIQRNGVPKKFFKTTYIYLFLGKYKYWTMGNPPEETTIINRADNDDL